MKKILIVGAGEGGKRLYNQIIKEKKSWQVVGFVDDKPSLKNQNVFTKKVLGNTQLIPILADKYQINTVLVAIPSLRGKKLEKIIGLIKQTGADFKILPGIFESLNYYESKQVPPGRLRKVELSDLLDREPINLDAKTVSGYLKNKTILITGAGGTIGSELTRQILQFQPNKIFILDIYENNLSQLKAEIVKPEVAPIIADIKDAAHLEQIFKDGKIQIIFHAAAHKHVHLMEEEPQEAVKNNILGSNNLIFLAIKYGVEKFIFISTDKAVEPASVMGATKRFTEQEILTQETGKTIFTIVRFGNVLGSYGSVIPLWQKQIENKQPLTITHPEMKRFFMTISEAVGLVIQATAFSKKTGIFALKVGKQYKIIDLAYGLIKLTGLKINQDIKIKITQPRVGEKLSEMLHEKNERLQSSKHPMIVRIIPQKPILTEINRALNKFKTEIDKLSKKEIMAIFKKTIPTFKSYLDLSKPKKISKTILFSPPAISEEEIKAVTQVLQSGWLTMGPKVLEFEKTFAEFHRVKYAVGVNSATAGLHLALLTLGIGPGDEVILPSYTFVSCANTVVQTGATPVFADIEGENFLIDPQDIERKITKNTKAVMVVHFGGQSADMEAILKLARRYHLKIIEDCAHSPGAKFNRQLVGTFGDISVFSFYATKNLTTGEGGMVLTRNIDWADKIRTLRLHGMSQDAYNRYSEKGKWYYEITSIGFKYNMTDLEAALGLVQLGKLSQNNLKRQEIANWYIADLAGTESLILPQTLPGRTNVWHLFPVLVPIDKRDRIIEGLKEYNIMASVHFIPLHLQPYYRKTYGYKLGSLPQSEEIYRQEISLPMHPNLTRKEVKYISGVLKYLWENV